MSHAIWSFASCGPSLETANWRHEKTLEASSRVSPQSLCHPVQHHPLWITRYLESYSKENCLFVCYLKKSLKWNGLKVREDFIKTKHSIICFFFMRLHCSRISLITAWMEEVTERVFIKIFSYRATGFHRRTKRFELNSFIQKTFLLMVKPGKQNHPQSQLICLMTDPEWNSMLKIYLEIKFSLPCKSHQNSILSTCVCFLSRLQSRVSGFCGSPRSHRLKWKLTKWLHQTL